MARITTLDTKDFKNLSLILNDLSIKIQIKSLFKFKGLDIEELNELIDKINGEVKLI